VAGALAWTVSFTVAGFFFGNLEAVKENFSLLIIAIIVISFVPSIVELLRNRGKEKAPTAVGAVKSGP
jgi:membrane-associated protein